MTEQMRLLLIVLASVLGAGTVSACGSDARLVHGDVAGPLDAGDGSSVDGVIAPTVKIGETWMQSYFFSNHSGRSVRIENAGPTALPPQLELVKARLWLRPPHTPRLMPAIDHWPSQDPRVARDTVPAEQGLVVPPHRDAEVVVVVKAVRRGLARIEGASVRFTDRGRSYYWRFDSLAAYPVDVPQPRT